MLQSYWHCCTCISVLNNMMYRVLVCAGLYRCAKREDLMEVNYQILEKVVQALREFSEKVR